MGIVQSFKLAVSNIIGNKMRSFLTMLGMIIGVASVIILISLMNGVTAFVIDQFTAVGSANMVQVNLPERTDNKRVTEADVYKFVEDNSDIITGVTPYIQSQMLIRKGKEEKKNYGVIGASEQYMTLMAQELGSGRDLQYSDMENRARVCLIGTYNAKKFFPNTDDPIGQTLRLSGVEYTVVGTRKETDGGKEGGADDTIIVPYTTLMKQTFVGQSTLYIFTAIDPDHAPEVETKIKTFLYNIYHDEDMYSTLTMAALINMATSITNTLSTVLAGIAAISLLVAGIGIMNIMLVSVTERTKEIGIRKSLGAKKKDIMRQFVIEASVTSGVGGLIGILLGAGCTILVGKMVGISATPTLAAIAISFGVSVAIGITFGYMPANKAANLNPIDALRTE